MDLNLELKDKTTDCTIINRQLLTGANGESVIRLLRLTRSPEEFTVYQHGFKHVDGKTWLDKNLKKPYDILEVYDGDIDNLKKDNLIIKATDVSELGTANSLGLDHYLQSNCIVIRVNKTGELIPAKDWSKMRRMLNDKRT